VNKKNEIVIEKNERVMKTSMFKSEFNVASQRKSYNESDLQYEITLLNFIKTIR